MIAYFLKRLLWFIPVLFLISLMVFFIARSAPGDPALIALEQSVREGGGNEVMQNQLQSLKKQYGLDKPAFYFDICLASTPLELKGQLDNETYQTIKIWSFRLGSAALATKLYQTSNNLSADLPPTASDMPSLLALLEPHNPSLVEKVHRKLKQPVHVKNFLPVFHWHGPDNQYHLWLQKFLSGNYGTSYRDGRKVSDKIGSALLWTLLLSSTSILCAFLLAVPLGLYAGMHENSVVDKVLSQLFFAFYALPTFWVGTLLIVLLANPDVLSLFPSYGVGEVSSSSDITELLQQRLHHLFLPFILIPAGAFIDHTTKTARLYFDCAYERTGS